MSWRTLIRNPRNHYCGADQGIITDNPNTWTVPPTLKSIYDPCPYGYRVPPSSSFNGFPNSCDPWTYGDITGGAAAAGTWWLPNGFRWPDSAALAAADGHAMIFAGSPSPLSLSLACGWVFRSDGLSWDHNPQRAVAAAIRCIPE